MTMEKTLDLEDELARVEDRLADVREAAAEIDAKLDAADVDGDPDPDDFQEWAALEEEFTDLQGKRNEFQAAIDEWDGTEFVIKKLTFGEVNRVKDEVNQASYEVEDGQFQGVPRSGLHELKTVELGLVSTPVGAPDDVRNYPYWVGEWLFEEINQLSTMGGADISDFSLREAISSTESQTNS